MRPAGVLSQVTHKQPLRISQTQLFMSQHATPDNNTMPCCKS